MNDRPPPIAALLPASLRARYEVRRGLGAGAMGAVLLVLDRELGREVAIKIIRGPESPEARKRFRREAQALAALEHPHVLRVYDFGEAPEGAYLITEYVPGASLDRVEELPDLPARMLEVADALDALHARELTHRDVKPANILISESGRAVLIDLGLVQDPASTILTATGQVVGTPAFLAPEVLEGAEAGAASDWYGWGATWFTLAVGRYPYGTDAIMASLRGAPLPAPDFSGTSLGSPVRALLERCLERTPDRRPADAAAVRRLLSETPRPTSRPRPRAAPSRRSRGAPRVALVGTSLLLGLVWIGRRLAPPHTPATLSRAEEEAHPRPAGRSRLATAIEAVRRELRAVEDVDADPRAWPALAAALPSLPSLRRLAWPQDLHDPSHPDRPAVLALQESFHRLQLPAPLERMLQAPPARELEPEALGRYLGRDAGVLPKQLQPGSWLGALEQALRQVRHTRQQLEAALESPGAMAAFMGVRHEQAATYQLTGALRGPQDLAYIHGQARGPRLRWRRQVGEGLRAMERALYALARLTLEPGREAELAAQVSRRLFNSADKALLLGPLGLEGAIPVELEAPRTPAAWLVRAELDRGLGDILEKWDVPYVSRELGAYQRADAGPVPGDPVTARLAASRRARARVEALELRIVRGRTEDYPALAEEVRIALQELPPWAHGSMARYASRRMVEEGLSPDAPPGIGKTLLATLEGASTKDPDEKDRREYARLIRRLRAHLAASGP